MRRRSIRWIRAAGALVLTVALVSGAAVFFVQVVSVASPNIAQAAAAVTPLPEFSADDQACLECHGSEEAAAKHTRDERKPGVVAAAAYARSLHADFGCTGCHEDVKVPAHPGKTAPAKSAKARKLAMTQVCRGCHAKIAKAYDRSVHAQRIQAGQSGPGCSHCHVAHEVTHTARHDGTNNSCSPCHDDAADVHREWLPNAARHLQTVACNACHSPLALAQVNLRLTVKPGAVVVSDAIKPFEQMAEELDTNHDGLDAHEFRMLLEALEQQGTPVTVGGRIETRNRIQAHMLPEKERAVRECFACHDKDAPPYKRVTVSMLDAEGTPVHYDAQREVLTSAATIEALKGFYVLGGTRMSQLDLMLALCLGVGISIPALHFVARRFMSRSRKNKG